MRILVAGSTGVLGRHVTTLLKASGHSVRRLVRSGQPVPGCETWRGDLVDASSIRGACEGIDVVLSCAGASMKLGNWADRQSFAAVDAAGHSNLLQEAAGARIAKFIYVSLHSAEKLMHTEYAAAHETFVQQLRDSRIAHTVVRPTGFFGFLEEIQAMARKGRGVVVGDGQARTNPIDERDVADACVGALGTDSPDEIPVGGPNVYTREGIVRLAFESIGRCASITHIPAGALGIMIAPVKLINPRLHALMKFGVEVSGIDVIAPTYGRRTLVDYFSERE